MCSSAASRNSSFCLRISESAKMAAAVGDGDVAFLDLEKAEQLRGFDDGEEIVELEG